ncbi:hypothetical protein UFOVP275_34 [uncultured Caudovirales phage]|uniref:Uncharacterized protein n=1 Tax=uncultured Caudovirales phage TaxID=2100421 RepID=A0A6J5LP97_9CAUD|nr:hypothetical protein UFOVP275_34 [uncultured Caudovirales phage]
MAYTIDPANKIIVLDSATVTAQSIYVAWADWMLVSDNAKYLPAFSSTGGDALGGGLFIPPYYFLINGWRVRPMESSHNLTITGNLFVGGGGVPVVPTVGTYQVNVNYTVPVQAQGISTSGSTAPTAAEVAAAVLASLMATAIPVNMTKVKGQTIGGSGTEASPWGPAA